MARLPQPGGDNGDWGNILNDFLSQSLKNDGLVKDNAVTANTIAPGAVISAAIATESVSKTKLSPSLQSSIDKAESALQTAPVTSVAGKVNAVTLTSTDVGLNNVDNTSDATKNNAVATLTNKTLTDPKIDTIKDVDGNTSLDIINNTNAVNHVYISNQPTGAYPGLGVDGADANIGFDVIPKGNGAVRVFASSGNTPTLQAVGTDTNLNLNLIPKGTGRVRANGVAIPTVTSADTLSSKRITPRVGSVSTGVTLTPNADTQDQFNVTSLGTAATIAAPSGTPVDGQKLILRILDDNSQRTLTWDTIYKPTGVVLPSSTLAGKTLYVLCIYNASAAKWDVVSVAQEM